MRTSLGIALSLTMGAMMAGEANAADIIKRIVAEVDPVAPASAGYEQTKDGVNTQKWGGNVDFNIGGWISTGPEIWVGNFTVKGGDGTSPYRRQDFYPG